MHEVNTNCPPRVPVRVRRFKGTCSYDGTEFFGWQQQSDPEKPTIQGVLSQRLSRFLKEPTRVIGSGRTDAGVHAIAQVFCFDVNVYENENLEVGINSLTNTVPVRNTSTKAKKRKGKHQQWGRGDFVEDICRNPNAAFLLLRALKSLPGVREGALVVTNVEEVNENFHARLSVSNKRYRYVIREDSASPFEDRYCWALGLDRSLTPGSVVKRLDIKTMKKAAEMMKGEHDMRNFAIMQEGDPRNPVRHLTMFNLDVYDVAVDPVYTAPTPTYVSAMYRPTAYTPDGEDQGTDEIVGANVNVSTRPTYHKIVITVECDYFLMRMVRMLVGTLVDVGLGAVSLERLAVLLTPSPSLAHSNSHVRDQVQIVGQVAQRFKRPDGVRTAPARGLYMVCPFYDGVGTAIG
eukprot:CFRG2219T1